MRRVMDNSQADARKVLRWLGRNGYTEVEPYWRFEWTPQQFRAELDAAGAEPRVRRRARPEHDEPQLSHPGDEQAEFKTAKAGIDYLRNVSW
jgi:hypothetical protein